MGDRYQSGGRSVPNPRVRRALGRLDPARRAAEPPGRHRTPRSRSRRGICRHRCSERTPEMTATMPLPTLLPNPRRAGAAWITPAPAAICHIGERVDPDLTSVIASVADGDRAAFGSLYDALAPSVFGVSRRVLRDPAQAEEVTQEVFVEIWRLATRFDPARGSVRTWAM